jgi:hypothetical protein
MCLPGIVEAVREQTASEGPRISRRTALLGAVGAAAAVAFPASARAVRPAKGRFLNNLDKIPPRGALAYVGLIPWEEGSGGPARVIANW